jgi:hypothetical protein
MDESTVLKHVFYTTFIISIAYSNPEKRVEAGAMPQQALEGYKRFLRLRHEGRNLF